jgi:hypothetical protein
VDSASSPSFALSEYTYDKIVSVVDPPSVLACYTLPIIESQIGRSHL